MKEKAYNAVVRPTAGYGATVWELYMSRDKQQAWKWSKEEQHSE